MACLFKHTCICCGVQMQTADLQIRRLYIMLPLRSLITNLNNLTEVLFWLTRVLVWLTGVLVWLSEVLVWLTQVQVCKSAVCVCPTPYILFNFKCFLKPKVLNIFIYPSSWLSGSNVARLPGSSSWIFSCVASFIM